MNKKANTVLFVLGATLVNILMMILVFLVLFILFARFLAPVIPPTIGQFAILALFIIAMIATYFLYHRLVVFLQSRIDMEKYFDPIFGKKRPR